MPGLYSAQKMYTHPASTTNLKVSPGSQKLPLASAMVTAMGGSVQSSSQRRPYRSMVHTAGKAPKKLTRPNTTLAQFAIRELPPEEAKMVEE
jgi:hypothetical protein